MAAAFLVLSFIVCPPYALGAKPPDAGHTHDASAIVSGTLDDDRLSSNVTMDNEVMGIVLNNDGADSGLDADMLDGLGSSDLALAVHPHDAADIATGQVPDDRISDVLTVAQGGNVDGAAIKSGLVAEARIDSAVTRDGEVMPIVLDSDGTGSTLDADLLDGLHSSDMALAGHNHVASDIVSGELPDARVSDALTVSSAGLVAGEAVKSGTVSDARLSNNVTKQGNAFNAANQLVKLDSSGKLPALDGSNLTGLSAGIPSGGIIMWSGSVANVPSGWVLCDGTNGTPNLQERFILGAGAGRAVGATGGSASHAHSGGSAGTATDARWVDDNSGGDDHWVSGNNHTHAFTTDSASNLPPFYALAFIMKL